MNSLDSKYIEGQALRHPSQDRYDDQRSGKCDSNEGPDDLKFTGQFHGQANLDTGKVAGYYYNIYTRVTFENPSSTQAQDDEKGLLNQRI